MKRKKKEKQPLTENNLVHALSSSSVYPRVYDDDLQKCLWYIFKHGITENCHDGKNEAIIAQTIQEEGTSWDDDIGVIGTCIYKFDGTNVSEPLSSPPPKFRSLSTVFFHAVDVLDKLIFGSFEENIIYFYDSNGTRLEKVKKFAPEIKEEFTDTIVVGNFLIWLWYDKLYAYDLLERILSREQIVGNEDG